MAGGVIDFSRLPAPEAVDALDYEATLNAALDKLLDLLPDWDVGDLESDPAKKVLEVYAYLDMLLRARINDAIRALLLAYALGADLDQLAANVEVTRLSGESDTRLRARTQQAFWSIAAAGPASAYRWHAMSVSAEIADVSVSSPASGQVTVAVLAPQAKPDDASADELEYGLAAFSAHDTILARTDHATLDAVRTALDADAVRPLTDTLSVTPPTVVPIAVDATLALYPGPDEALVLAEAQSALDTYLESVKRIGYDVTRAGILDALVVSGVRNVTLAEPAADVICTATELALVTSSVINTEEARDV